MTTRKTTTKDNLAIARKKQERIVQEIKKKFGSVIDLDRSPFVLVEIFREFGRRFEDGEGGGGGGVEPSSIAVAGPPDPPDPPEEGQFESRVILNALVKLQRDVSALNKKLDQAVSTRTR